MNKTKKKPKKISPRYLENAGLYYLQRYASSAANFRRVMMRKIKKSCRFHQEPVEDFIPLLDDLIARYEKVGLLNDESYAVMKTAGLRQSGKSARAIQAKLRVKGLSPEQIETALKTVDETEDAEFQAALKLTRKKKIGAYRKDHAIEPEQFQKELATLARAGFSYDIARKALSYCEDITPHPGEAALHSADA